jgi:hypothetical protein
MTDDFLHGTCGSASVVSGSGICFVLEITHPPASHYRIVSSGRNLFNSKRTALNRTGLFVAPWESEIKKKNLESDTCEPPPTPVRNASYFERIAQSTDIFSKASANTPSSSLRRAYPRNPKEKWASCSISRNKQLPDCSLDNARFNQVHYSHCNQLTYNAIDHLIWSREWSPANTSDFGA